MPEPRRGYRLRAARILGIAFMFFWLSSIFYAENRICCMFSSCRHYGFPAHFVALCKSPETYTEASLIESENAFALLERGWKFEFASDPYNPLPGPAASLVVDGALALMFGLAADAVYLFLKKRNAETAKSKS
jgi:hypothetical protein